MSEAAALIGVSERTVRRVLKVPQLAARTLTGQRPTATGCRACVLLPPSLVAELASRLQGEEQARNLRKGLGQNAGRNGGTNTGTTPATPATTAANTGNNGGTRAAHIGENTGNNAGRCRCHATVVATVPPVQEMQLAAVYETLLREKDARISDLSAQVERLHEALHREQDSHARTQTLVALSPPIKPSRPSLLGRLLSWRKAG